MYNELYHHGILGMRWGVRRYRNADGTLTAAGRKQKMKGDVKSATDQYSAKDKKIHDRFNAARKDKKSGKISKEDFKKEKRRYVTDYQNNQAKHVENVYNIVKKYNISNAEFLKAEKGEKSLAYKRARKRGESLSQAYGGAIITKNKDGGYTVQNPSQLFKK